jgi:hypothetical protein
MGWVARMFYSLRQSSRKTPHRSIAPQWAKDVLLPLVTFLWMSKKINKMQSIIKQKMKPWLIKLKSILKV